MFDCGIPYKQMKDELYKVDTLLLTHTHGDHIKKKTLESIKKEFPRIKVYGNFDVAKTHGDYLDKTIGIAPLKLTKKRTVFPWEGVHDVPVTYYFLDLEGIKVLYATDTCVVENPYGWKFDYMFLESNYDETKLNEVRRNLKRGQYDPANQSFRHLSTQKCKDFWYLNRVNRESPLIELHKSSRFY